MCRESEIDRVHWSQDWKILYNEKSYKMKTLDNERIGHLNILCPIRITSQIHNVCT